jgi:uncharacterized protein YjiS (DUF1127 family)
MSSQLICRSIARNHPADGIETSRRLELSPMLTINVRAIIRNWIARGRERRALGELAEMNAHLLRDIGLSKDDAQREAAKWFWQGRDRYKAF